MNNYRFTISYDGSRYSGWEHQKHTDDTIQGKIETVLAKMCETDTVKLVGAGRTDAGVHAKAMTANALLDTTLPVREIRDYMNRYLPDDIVILRFLKLHSVFTAVTMPLEKHIAIPAMLVRQSLSLTADTLQD